MRTEPSYNTRFQSDSDENKGLRLLREAEQLFRDRHRFLQDRERAFRYMFGDQWSDKIKDPNTGKTITEEEYILNDGRLPIKNNMIGKMVRNLIGQFRNNYPDAIAFARTRDNAEAGDKMTSALQAVLDKNEIKEIDAREFEEFMVSAGFGWKIQYKWWSAMDHEDVYIQPIDQTRFFYNMDSLDIRNHDVSVCGEIHDLSMDDVIGAFAQTPKEAREMEDKFPYIPEESYFNRYPEWISKYRNFYLPDNDNQVRVIEYWKKEKEWLEFVHDLADATFTSDIDKFFVEQGMTLEEIDQFDTEDLVDYVNQMRIMQAAEQGIDPEAVQPVEYESRYEDVWKVYYITPLGEILDERVTPYDHQEHPYEFGLYPLMDGRTMSLVTSIIDQQRFINRIIQLYDKGLGQSVQNLMWVPEDIVPEGMDRQEFADQSVTHNGMMFYTPKRGVEPPSVIRTNAGVVGSGEILNIMQDYMNNISSVNDAIQGEEPSSNTPASLYAQRVNNAAIGNKDYFDFFFAVTRRRNRKIIQLVKQYYKEPRYIRVAGSGFTKGVNDYYDPEEVRNIDFDVVIGETQDTLAYRQTVDTYLMQFLNNQFITFEEFLQTTSLPFADQLLEQIRNRREQMKGQMPEGMTPEQMQAMAQQMQEGGDQQPVNN